jgi:hypothetical protein
MPAEGGNPEAIEMPKHKGKAIKNTKKPDSKSLRQFSFKPAKPVLGNAEREELLIIHSNFEKVIYCLSKSKHYAKHLKNGNILNK